MSPLEEDIVDRLMAAVFEGSVESGATALDAFDYAEPGPAFGALRRIVSPLGPGEQALSLLEILIETARDSADPDLTLANWERFFDASFGRAATASSVVADPGLAETLSRLFGHSQYLADILMLNPEQVDWLRSTVLERDKSLEAYETEMTEAVSLFLEESSQRDALCRYHRRELLRIGLRDMKGIAPLERVTAELSDLAQSAVRVALRLSEERCQARFGRPMREDDKTPCGFAVIALGKLGGRELNYSSDIDLMFVFDAPGKTTGVSDATGHTAGSVSNGEYFAKLGATLIEFLSQHGSEGHLYRVDMRLRPEGKSGALAHSFAACQNYYLARARPWERVALLKARGVAGDPRLVEQFHQLAAGFVYAPADPATLLSEIARLKDTIDSRVLASADADREIKRGRGGIREIEFTVAVLEILYGETRPQLRRRSTLSALQALRNERILVPDDADLLEKAYRFFRRIEHALQCVAWRQTHLIPTDERAVAALAKRCGMTGDSRAEVAARFDQQRRRLSAAVHNLFDETFRVGRTPETKERLPAYLLLDDMPGREEREKLLARWRLRDASVADSLRRLGRGTANLYLSSAGQRAFEQLLPAFLEIVSKVPWPDRAVRHFESFVQSCGNASGYYRLFQENEAILELLVRLFGTNGALSERLISNPGWFDPLISPETFESGATWLRVGASPPGGKLARPPDPLPVLRHFAFLGGLRLGVRHILGLSSPAQTADALSRLAESCLEAAASWAIDDTLCDKDANGAEGLRFAVLGLGKLARRELTFQSDLDVVFVSEAGGRPSNLTQSLFARTAERLIHYLTDPSAGGAPFSIDARLRPEGKNSPLVTALSGLKRYFQRRSDVWEIQAYLGARVVAGDRGLGTEALKSVWQVIGRLGSREEIAQAVFSMRRRLERSVSLPRWAAVDFKRGRGGLVDLEFLSQYLQIVHAGECPEIVGYPPRRVLQHGAAHGCLEPELAEVLVEDYDFLRRLETDVRLVLETQQTCFPAERTRLEALAHAPGREAASGDLLRRELEQRTARIRECFLRVLDRRSETDSGGA